METNRNRAWLYCRTAHKDAIAMQIQTDDLTRYAKERGYVIAGITQEYGGGLSLNRRGIAQVKTALDNGKAAIVLVKDFSRIARRSQELFAFVRFLQAQHVSLESVTDSGLQSLLERCKA